MMKQLLAVLLVLLSLVAQAKDTKTIHVQSSQKVIEITLPANPSTGYQWSLDNYDHSLLKLQSQRYEASQPKLIGASGISIFTFEKLDKNSYPKKTAVTLQYGRSWEPSTATQTIIVII